METLSQKTGKLEHAIGGNSTQEGAATKKIEQVTASIPSSAWLMLAGGAVALALGLKVMGKATTANFVGQWAPTFLMLGLYNKVVKVMGSDRTK